MPLEKPPTRSPARSASPTLPRHSRRSAAGTASPGEPYVQGQHLGGGEPRLVAEELGQVADPGPGARVRRRPPEQQHLPRVGPDQAEQDLDDAGLAGPVGPEQTRRPRRGRR